VVAEDGVYYFFVCHLILAQSELNLVNSILND